MSKPEINVTPLIDVLLVLLIIFMIAAPMKPSSIKARVPTEPTKIPANIEPNPKALVVEIDRNTSLALNRETGLGTAADTGPLVTRLRAVFAERQANGDVSDQFADDPLRPYADRIERTVFIKGPSELDYGSVVRVVDAVKLAGAYPISLQIDRLDQDR